MPRSKRSREPDKACAGKIAYATWGDAESVVVELIDKNIRLGHPEWGNRLGVYRCEYCRGWHIGHGTDARVLRDRMRTRARPTAPAASERSPVG